MSKRVAWSVRRGLPLPSFDKHGNLPPADYELTLDELKRSSLVVPPAGISAWDEAWRGQLVENLAVLVGQLGQVGISEIYVDGSFVADKAHPNDIDAYFDVDRFEWIRGHLRDALSMLDPKRSWDSTRRLVSDFDNKQHTLLWHNYRVDLFPNFGQPSGVVGRSGHPLVFPDLFRQDRLFRSRGIVKIVRKEAA